MISLSSFFLSVVEMLLLQQTTPEKMADATTVSNLSGNNFLNHFYDLFDLQYRSKFNIAVVFEENIFTVLLNYLQ